MSRRIESRARKRDLRGPGAVGGAGLSWPPKPWRRWQPGPAHQRRDVNGVRSAALQPRPAQGKTRRSQPGAPKPRRSRLLVTLQEHRFWSWARRRSAPYTGRAEARPLHTTTIFPTVGRACRPPRTACHSARLQSHPRSSRHPGDRPLFRCLSAVALAEVDRLRKGRLSACCGPFTLAQPQPARTDAPDAALIRLALRSGHVVILSVAGGLRGTLR